MQKFQHLLVCIFIATFLFVPGSLASWQNTGGDLQHSGYSESPPVPLELLWKFKTGGAGISAPVVNDGILFVGSDDKNIYAIDEITGKLKWSYPTLGNVYTPTAKDGMVFAASFDNNIYALDNSGNLKWKYNTGSSVASPPVSYDNILFGGFDKNIYAIYIINGSLKWKYPTDGRVESTPAISQGIVYAGSTDNYIYALNAENKILKWRYRTEGGVSSSPSVVTGVVYAGSNDNNLYAIESDGTLKWKKKTNDWIKSSPAVLGKSVYTGSNDNTFYSMKVDNGDILWQFRTGGHVDSPAIVTREIVYVGSKDGTIYALDKDKGSLIDKYTVGQGIIAIALSDNLLFATSEDGYVYAFGKTISGVQTGVPAIPSDTTPPELRINPVPLNVISERLDISGSAQDPSGILAVTVNGIYAGTTNWNATLTLSNGMNVITIVAVDGAGNVKTERRTVTYTAEENLPKTTPARIPGFDLLYGVAGIFMAVYIMISNRK
ncbi:Outer membrane protein assembly factor BamB [uncultured archaeon]|nr:Outer membrane protein assembly factor BamB [uncultured archaeon]